jgi:hypothetical protein
MARLPFSVMSAILLSLVAAACARPASPLVMAAYIRPPIEPPPAYRDAIMVAAVSGGLDTDPLSISEVDNRRFADALELSLRDARLGTFEGGRFRLEAYVKKLDQPVTPSPRTVTATIMYQLSEVPSGDLYYQRTLITAATSSSVETANEEAMRANIAKLIEELDALPDRPLNIQP